MSFRRCFSLTGLSAGLALFALLISGSQLQAQALLDAPPQPKIVVAPALDSGTVESPEKSADEAAAEKPAETMPDTENSEGKVIDRESKEGESSEADSEVAENAEAMAKESATTNQLDSETDSQLQQVILGKVSPSLQDLRSIQERVSQLVGRLRPSVVGIQMEGGQGSGVIVSADGYILTAAHVVGQRGKRATVVMEDGSKHPAVVLGTDSQADSGMIRLLDKGPWPYADIGESSPLLEGQWVMALGHPGGFDPDRDSVVRVGRMLTKPGKTTLQSDCTLVGGDSGGPLFDLDGFVIGIHSRISRRIQQNYHVSVDIFTSEWDSMAREPKPYFGFSLEDIETTQDLIIKAVDGPAKEAGMEVKDQLLKINGKSMKERSDIRDSIKGLRVFDKLKIVVKRGDKEKKLELTLGGQ